MSVLKQVLARLEQAAFTDSKEMLAIITKCGVRTNAIDMTPTGDGTLITKAQATKIRQAFKQAKYKPYEQLEDYWVIESEKDETVGVVIDLRPEMSDIPNKFRMAFFDNKD